MPDCNEKYQVLMLSDNHSLSLHAAPLPCMGTVYQVCYINNINQLDAASYSCHAKQWSLVH